MMRAAGAYEARVQTDVIADIVKELRTRAAKSAESARKLRGYGTDHARTWHICNAAQSDRIADAIEDGRFEQTAEARMDATAAVWLDLLADNAESGS